MSDFEIKSHELIYLENKRKSKANSFYIFKFNENNVINFVNKKISVSKKANSIDVNSNDKKMVTVINDEIKTNLEKYVSDNEIDIKNNLTKIVFNDLVNNNKISFGISDEVDSSFLLNKATKHNCVLNIMYIILVFTGQKSCEVSTKLNLTSMKSNDDNDDNDNDNDNKSLNISILSDITMTSDGNNEDNIQNIKKNVITVNKKKGKPAALKKKNKI